MGKEQPGLQCLLLDAVASGQGAAVHQLAALVATRISHSSDRVQPDPEGSKEASLWWTALEVPIDTLLMLGLDPRERMAASIDGLDSASA